MAEVIGVALHGQAVNADGDGTLFFGVPHARGGIVACLFQHSVGDMILACAVAFHNGGDHILRHVGIIRQQLLGVLGQAIAAVAEGGIVIKIADTGIQTHALDNIGGIQPLDLGIGIQLVEIADSERQIGIGEQLDGLRLVKAHQQRFYILLESALLQEGSKGLGSLNQSFITHIRSDNNARGIQIIIQRLGFS